MAKRIKYEIEGKKVPSLNNILDNCKIGGIGNLLYRANQAGLAGRQLKDAGEDNTNAGWLAFKRIDQSLNNSDFDIDNYSYSCVERSENCYVDFAKFCINMDVVENIKNLTLVSESLKYGDTFDVFSADNNPCVLIMLVIQNEIYPENLIKLAARANLLKENGIGEVTKSYILQVNNPKTVDDPVILTIHEYDELSYPLEVFVRMRDMFEMQETLKTLV